MHKIKPEHITADWSGFENHCPWDYISSPDLAKILGVHLQTISNYKLRRPDFPVPEPKASFNSGSWHKPVRGNKCLYKISTIMNWLTGESEESIHWKFIRKHFSEKSHPFVSLDAAIRFTNKKYKQLGIKQPLLTTAFRS